jgi:uncharacterized protein
MKTTLQEAWPVPAVSHVDEAVRRLVEAFDPLRIVVFGSYVRGNAGHGSDLDLLVVMSAVDDKREKAIEMRRVLGGMRVPFDVFVATPEEIERRGWIIGTVLREALKEGEEVYRKPERP